MILCAQLMRAQERKAGTIRHNAFVKKYRIIRKPIIWKTESGGEIHIEEISFELRKDFRDKSLECQCCHSSQSGKCETEGVSSE